MFVCNEERQKRYLKERREQEINDDRQQDVIDEMNAERLGFERSATQLSRLGKRVFTDLIENTTTQNEKKVVDILKNTFNTPAEIKKSNPTLIDFIKAGTLSQLFDKIKQINPKTLSKKSKIIQTDLKNNTMLKDVLNENIINIVNDSSMNEEDKPATIENVVIEVVAGGDKKIINELLNEASLAGEASLPGEASVPDAQGKKNRDAKDIIDAIYTELSLLEGESLGIGYYKKWIKDNLTKYPELKNIDLSEQHKTIKANLKKTLEKSEKYLKEKSEKSV